jgi:hypothetical protein
MTVQNDQKMTFKSLRNMANDSKMTNYYKSLGLNPKLLENPWAKSHTIREALGQRNIVLLKI